MSLPHALLTSLLEESCSGAELARRFERSIGFFWHAAHQQIYRELSRLELAGWVESLPPENGRGRKKVYRVLPAGREALRCWTDEGQDPKPLREELMLRLRAEAVIGPTKIKDDIARRLAIHKNKLTVYKELEARDFPPGAMSHEMQLQHLVLTAGIMSESLWIEWSELALKVLAQR